MGGDGAADARQELEGPLMTGDAGEGGHGRVAAKLRRHSDNIAEPFISVKMRRSGENDIRKEE